jgi:chromosome segregation ATPase
LRTELERAREDAALARAAAEEAAAVTARRDERLVEIDAKLDETVSQLAVAIERAETAERESVQVAERAGVDVAATRAELEAATARLSEAQSQVVDLTERVSQLEEHGSSLARALEDERRASERAAGATAESADALNAATSRVAELEQQVQAAATRADALTATVADLEGQLAAVPPPAEASPADDRLAELERANAELADELEQMGTRLRRAYADAEDARAQLSLAAQHPASLAEVGGPASADGYDEMNRLRLELGRAVERANAAETRASKLQADLAEARGGSTPDPAAEQSDEPSDTADREPAEEERSLRFRLAKTAASKKKSGPDSMWS